MEPAVTFGEKQPGIRYKDRQGVYAVILNRENRSVAVVRTPTGYFLPGGGIESGESHEECLRRECLEEIGCEIDMGAFIGRAEKYFYSTTHCEHMVSDGFFYRVNIVRQLDTLVEGDHELVWVNQKDVDQLLFLEHQVWAVKKALEIVTPGNEHDE